MSMNFTNSDCQCQSEKLPLILALDDKDDELMLLSYVVKLLNYAFVGATSCQTGLVIAKERQPRLILSDISMPDENGIEFIHQLKQDSRTCNIPVIAVTALAKPEDRVELLASGFANYISKPYLIEDLEAIIRQYCPTMSAGDH